MLFQEFLNRRKMTEFGNLALIDQDAGEESGVAIPLPGVRKGAQRVPPVPMDSAVAGHPDHLLFLGSSRFTPLLVL